MKELGLPNYIILFAWFTTINNKGLIEKIDFLHGSNES